MIHYSQCTYQRRNSIQYQQQTNWMKHNNFMDSLTDEMMRENHKLKDQLVDLRRKVRNYQDQIYRVIVQVDPNFQIHQQFQVMLVKFGKTFTQQKKNFEELKTSYQQVSQMNEHLKQENLQMIKELQQKSSLDEEIIERWESEKEKLKANADLYKNELNDNLEKMTNLKKVHNELRIQKLKIEESKRQQIESTCLEYHIELMAMKAKVEKEQMKIQKILRQEIQNKNKIIKEMSAYVEELQKTRPQNIETTSAYVEMFKRLEQYNAMTQIINELRNQNYQLRQQNKYLVNYKSSLQIKYKEFQASQKNLQSQIERMTIYMQEVQDKLTENTKHSIKLQKQKEQMDKYYSQRWVEQYKRVKNRLAKDMVKKINDVQESYNQKMAVMEARMYEAIGIKNQTIRRNEYLEDMFQGDQKQISKLNKDIEILSLKIAEFRQIVKQSEKISQEEHLVWKIRHHEQKTTILKKLTETKVQLKAKTNELEQYKLFHIKHTNQMNRDHQKALQKQKQSHQRQMKITKQFHNKETKKLMEQISMTSQQAQQTVKNMEENYKKEVARKKREFQSKLSERDLQQQRKHEKWIDKIQQMDNLYTQTKNRMEKNIFTLKQQLDELENKNQQLINTRQHLKSSIQNLMKEQQQWKKQMNELQKKIQLKNENIKELENDIQKLQEKLDDSRKEVQVLVRMRSDWKNELANLQFEYRQEFALLKKHFEKQKDIWRQKISELQDLNKKKAVNRKQYEQLKELHKKQTDLKEQMHVREAENIILSQIKDYYETQLKQAEHQITKNQLRQTNPVLTRKVKRKFNRPRKESSSNKVLQIPREDEWSDAKRYSINSYRKQFNYSLSKARLQETTNQSNNKNYRVKTSYAF